MQGSESIPLVPFRSAAAPNPVVKADIKNWRRRANKSDASTTENCQSAVPPGLDRARKWKEQWSDVVGIMPPQLNRQQISMISIGGAIGTGLFLGTNQALQHGGPLGLVLGYSLMGSVVYCVVISFGEMVAFQPAIGGPVGLANIYVDEALGFALGWNAWYNWSIILPAEISAAVVLMNYWSVFQKVNEGILTGIFIFLAVGVNSLGTRWYGRMEVGFTRVKVLTIVTLIVIGLLIDIGASRQGPILFQNWTNPGPLAEYAFQGAVGRFLGFFSVLLQAAFSFFGSEVPAIAACEVINAKANIPHAINRIWIRITLFYVMGVFVVSLLVPYNDPTLISNSQSGTATQSPFVIAINNAGYAVLPHLVNAAFILSAWSAATSDIYISSRFMYNLARLGHAPRFFGRLYRPPGEPGKEMAIPWVGIGIAALFAFLAYMKTATDGAGEVFSWLSSMASAAALQAWIGIMFTYIRWYQGTQLAIHDGLIEKSDLNLRRIQPYAAYYAFVMCILVLIFNGWAVFSGGWRLALNPGESWPPILKDKTISSVIGSFITSYLPIPIFIMLLFGYKLIVQTKLVPIRDMPSSLAFLGFNNEPEQNIEEERILHKSRWRRVVERVLNFLS